MTQTTIAADYGHDRCVTEAKRRQTFTTMGVDGLGPAR